MRDYNDLITDLDDWESHNSCEIGPDGWLAGMGSFNLAVAFSSLFWPEFVTHDDCVFMAPFRDHDAQNYQRLPTGCDDDKTRTEVTLNNQHLLDLFPNEKARPTREQVIYLGRTLKDMWQLKLNRDFPDRRMVVSFPEDYSDDLMDYEITFWQERASNQG
ncbi:hypothetical protein ACFQY0_20970 [Haloferula chungangensis]|uniref:Uncharacterized protein n=1 Tax=Haloferula chungangensis TaxID=1048331 RepID=A0ABW2LDI7_9BACT